MLARRFSIVCLMVAMFGMGLSTLVADADRRAPGTWMAPCGLICAPRALGF